MTAQQIERIPARLVRVGDEVVANSGRYDVTEVVPQPNGSTRITFRNRPAITFGVDEHLRVVA